MKIKFLAFFVVLLLVSKSQAAFDMFLKVDGIDGESLLKGHEKEIDVLAWSWGVSTPVTISGGGTSAGKANFTDISFTKYADSASPLLMLSTARGTHIPTVVFTVMKSGAAGLANYYRITLTEVLVTSVSTGGSDGESRLTENISLNYRTIKVEYFPQKPDGSIGLPVIFNWNLATNTQ